MNDNELIKWIIGKIEIMAYSRDYFIPRIAAKRLLIEINKRSNIKKNNEKKLKRKIKNDN